MEEVDKIIIHTLRDIGCTIEEDTSSLGQFTTNLVIEATVRCLEIINPAVKLPKSLPQNMAAKFHVCASIAECCKAEGYNGEVGYQTFLYSSGLEVRRILMFLIDRLPRETEKTVTEPEDVLSRTKDALGVALKQQMGERLRPGSVKSVPFVSYHLETGITMPGKQIHCNPQGTEDGWLDKSWFTEK